MGEDEKSKLLGKGDRDYQEVSSLCFTALNFLLFLSNLLIFLKNKIAVSNSYCIATTIRFYSIIKVYDSNYSQSFENAKINGKFRIRS